MTKPLTEQMAELRDWRDRMAPSYGPQAERTQYFGMARERRDRWRDVDRLLATVEAQAEVIQRYHSGWVACLDTQLQPLGMWSRKPRHERREPMPEAHQLVLYGEVVAPRGESDE